MMFTASVQLQFEIASMVSPVTLDNPGALLVKFTQPDGQTPLNTQVFTLTMNSLGDTTTPFTVNQINDSSLVGQYQVVFKIWVQNYPGLAVTSPVFSITVSDPCPTAAITLISPSPFIDQVYMIGQPEIQ